MRITMSMIQERYKNNLNSSKTLYEKYALRATTTRAYDKPSDDPLNCARSYDVQQSITMNNTYQSNISSIEDTQNTADSILSSMYTTLNSTIKTQLEGITSSSSQSDRNTLADTLLSARDSLVSNMNSSAAGKYLFAGSASESVPFTVDSDGNLLYRGINVNTGKNSNGACETISAGDKDIQINFGKTIGDKLNGYKISVSVDGSATDNTASVDTDNKTISITMVKDSTKGDLQDVLSGTDTSTVLTTAMSTTALKDIDLSDITISGITYTESDKLDSSYTDSGTEGVTDIVSLKDLANEKVYVDIGLGMTQNEDGSLNEQSAYNTASPGISFLGYGHNDDGVNENMYSLLTDMASTLKDTSLSGQDLIDTMDPLSNSFTDSLNNMYSQHSKLGTDMKSLETTQTYLSGLNTNLVTEESAIANVSPFTAITDWSQQVYFYQAALQVGTQLLQPSLIDYMS